MAALPPKSIDSKEAAEHVLNHPPQRWHKHPEENALQRGGEKRGEVSDDTVHEVQPGVRCYR
jgi:hypothetical protein